jgi:hypothetical protein
MNLQIPLEFSQFLRIGCTNCRRCHYRQTKTLLLCEVMVKGGYIHFLYLWTHKLLADVNWKTVEEADPTDTVLFTPPLRDSQGDGGHPFSDEGTLDGDSQGGDVHKFISMCFRASSRRRPVPHQLINLWTSRFPTKQSKFYSMENTGLLHCVRKDIPFHVHLFLPFTVIVLNCPSRLQALGDSLESIAGAFGVSDQVNLLESALNFLV